MLSQQRHLPTVPNKPNRHPVAATQGTTPDTPMCTTL